MTGSDFLRVLGALRQQPVRSALTLLGIVLGTSSLVLLVALLGGGEAALLASNQDANESDVVLVHSVEPPAAQRQRTRRPLSRADATELAAAHTLGDAWVGAERNHTTMAHSGAQKKRVTVASVDPRSRALYRIDVASGRYIDSADLERRAHVCVIGFEVARELFGEQSALGRTLRIDGDVWQVIGVLADKPMLGNTDSTAIWNRKVLVPETTFDATYNPERRAERLLVRPRSAAAGPDGVTDALPGGALTELPLLRRFVKSSLLRLHYGVLDFDVDPASRGQEALILLVLQVLLFGATLISLGVSGINIMNVMLVSVSERTVEIGIRRAAGATPRLIARQFLCEALVLSGAGGLIGVSLGAGLAALATLVLRQVLGMWTLHVEPWAMALGLGASLVVGVAFGLYPALRAARLDVVQALRNE